MYPGNTYFDCRTKELKEAIYENMCYAEKLWLIINGYTKKEVKVGMFHGKRLLNR